MRKATCIACGETHPIGRMFYARKGIHCPACVDVFMKDPHVPLTVAELRPLVDPTICAACEADTDQELQLVSGLRICGSCAARLKRPPIPVSIVAFWMTLLAAAGFAVDRSFDRVEDHRLLDSAQRAIESGRLARAAESLGEASACEKRTLLLIRHDLARDQVASAHNRKATLHGRWIPGGLHRDVLRELDLADMAVAEYAFAMRAQSEGKIALALSAIMKAKDHYPLSVRMKLQYLQIRGDYSFSRREYDDYIGAHSILGAENPDDPDLVLLHAAAMAAQWALRNDADAKAKAEELLARAKRLGLPAESERFVRHRIETRQLVSMREFERR